MGQADKDGQGRAHPGQPRPAQAVHQARRQAQGEEVGALEEPRQRPEAEDGTGAEEVRFLPASFSLDSRLFAQPLLCGAPAASRLAAHFACTLSLASGYCIAALTSDSAARCVQADRKPAEAHRREEGQEDQEAREQAHARWLRGQEKRHHLMPHQVSTNFISTVAQLLLRWLPESDPCNQSMQIPTGARLPVRPRFTCPKFSTREKPIRR